MQAMTQPSQPLWRAVLLALLFAGGCYAQTPLPRSGWTASATSAEAAREATPASNVLDGSDATIWHSKWSGTPAALPHSITIVMGTTNKDIGGITYRPRQDGLNGNIGAHRTTPLPDPHKALRMRAARTGAGCVHALLHARARDCPRAHSLKSAVSTRACTYRVLQLHP